MNWKGASVLAARVAFQNTANYQCQDWDLVDRCKMEKNFDITKVPDAELSDEMKKMTKEQRLAHVKKMTAEREGLQKQISELTAKRDAFIREEIRRNPNPSQRAFDAAIRETLRLQAQTRGIQIPE